MTDSDEGIPSSSQAQLLRQLADDPTYLKIAHDAIEDALIDFRDNRISLVGRGNGLVVRERNGEPSDVIRLGSEEALRIGLRAIADALAIADASKGPST